MTDVSPPLEVLVVSHTHWDREWYLPAGRMRQRLVPLVDELLDDADGAAGPFLLDGQTVLLEDYLAVRPERRAELSRALRRRVLEAGPWYVLADELIPSGEALVRNLLAGAAVMRALRAPPPPVLYSPDAFGHPAALPVLAAGFGCPVIITWRGYGGAAWPAGDTARWLAADGSEVLLHHLPPDGYEFGASLPANEREARVRWARLRAVLEPRAAAGVVMLPHGADHHARQRRASEALAMLQRVAAPARVRRASLADVARELARHAARLSLPVVRGELRDSSGYTWSLPGTLAARAAQKRRNALAERMLVRDAEPWVALARHRGGPDAAPLARAAWRSLLLCHPHDTLCGCATDEVARAMDARLDDALAQAEGLRDDALSALTGYDPDAAHARRAEWRPVVLVRNAAARTRGGVADVEILRVRQHVPVGPGSGGPLPPPIALAPAGLDAGRIPLQLLAVSDRHHRVESPRAYPVNDLVEAATGVAWVDAVPAYGVRALSVDDAPADHGAPPFQPVRASAEGLENEHLRVGVAARGEIQLHDRRSGRMLEPVLRFEDVGDAGDLYTHSACPPVVGTSAPVGCALLHAGPIRGVLRSAWRLAVPTASQRGGRAREVRELPFEVDLTLDAGAPYLRIRVSGTNLCRDHRLRAVFATGLAEADVFADAAFGTVQRLPRGLAADPAERLPGTAPLARYVTLQQGERGVTIYSDGLAEYEALPGGDLALTLLRAVGELSRNDLPERPGHAGWPVPTPAAQSLGPFTAEFAVFPHGARDAAMVDRIERVADDVLLPLTGSTRRAALVVPATAAGIELDGSGLACTTVKPADRGGRMVLRCVNLTGEPVEGRWRCAAGVGTAHLARLDETPVRRLAVRGGAVRFVAAPYATVTILVSRPARGTLAGRVRRATGS